MNKPQDGPETKPSIASIKFTTNAPRTAVKMENQYGQQVVTKSYLEKMLASSNLLYPIRVIYEAALKKLNNGE